MIEQLLPITASLVFGPHGKRRQFRRLARERVERGAADDDAVVFDHEEAVHFALEQFASAVDQGALGLQRFDQLQDAADVVDAGRAQALDLVGGDHAARTAVGEEFEQQRAVHLVRHHVRARHAGAHRLDCVAEVQARVRCEVFSFCEQ